MKNEDDSYGLEDAAAEKRIRTRMPIKDWYRQGSGEVPDIILRTAEEARKCLSNQKVVEVLVPLTEDGWRQIESLGSAIGPFDETKHSDSFDARNTARRWQ